MWLEEVGDVEYCGGIGVLLVLYCVVVELVW